MTGSEFQDRRKATGLSQRDLADYWQVGKSTIARLETRDGHVKRVYALALIQLESDPELYDRWRGGLVVAEV
jgi:predicted transcriptional regulator